MSFGIFSFFLSYIIVGDLDLSSPKSRQGTLVFRCETVTVGVICHTLGDDQEKKQVINVLCRFSIMEIQRLGIIHIQGSKTTVVNDTYSKMIEHLDIKVAFPVATQPFDR